MSSACDTYSPSIRYRRLLIPLCQLKKGAKETANASPTFRLFSALTLSLATKISYRKPKLIVHLVGSLTRSSYICTTVLNYYSPCTLD